MKKLQNGFTLIELMIVVAIIGILAAVAIPAYQDYVVKAKLSKVTSTLDSVKLALALYLQEQGSFPIATTAVSVTSPGGGAAAANSVWTSIGLTLEPVLPNEVKTMTYQTNAAGSNMALTLTLQNIRAGTVDTGKLAVSPVTPGTNVGTALTLPVAPAATETVLGGTALQWHYGCDTILTDKVAQKYFGNCS